MTAVTCVALFSAAADVELFSIEAGVKSFEFVWDEFDSIVDGKFDCVWGWPFGISSKMFSVIYMSKASPSRSFSSSRSSLTKP